MKMKVVLALMFVVIGSVYSRSLPEEPSDISVESLYDNPVPLIRKARQYGGTYGGFGGQGGYNQGYNQGYGSGGYNQGYNNYDLNPFNDSPNNYDLNPFNNYNTYGKKK